MKILMNCHEMPTAKEGSGGAGKYVQALIPALAEKSQLHVICSTRNAHEYNHDSIKKLMVVSSFDDLDIAKVFRDVDIYFNPSNKLTPLSIPIDIPVVTVIHDLQHNFYPYLFSNGGFEGRNHEYGYAIGRSDGLLAISNWEKSNFEKYYNIKNASVVHHSSYLFDKIKNDKNYTKVEKLTRFSNYYLYPAVAWPHKNHLRLIEAFGIINKRNPNKEFRLVLTGTVEHVLSTSLWNRKIKEMKGDNFIDVLGHVTDDELITLMSNAKGLVFPSLYEGFGIPIIDAMKFGIPVLASKISAIPEVTHDSVEYFENPYDSFQIAEDISKFDEKINNKEYDIEQAKKVSSEYSLDRMVTELLDFFTRVIETKKSNSPSIAAYSNKNLELSKPSKKVTIIVDLETSMNRTEDITFFLQNLLNNSSNENFDYALIMPYGFRELADKDLINKINKITTLAYYQDNQTSSKILALEHLLEVSIKTDYFIFDNILQFLNMDYFFVRTAVTNLDYFKDIYSCIKSNERGRSMLIIRPLDEAKAVREFNKMKGDEEATLSRFRNRVIRTSVCKLDGMIGTVSALSKDISKYSNIYL